MIFTLKNIRTSVKLNMGILLYNRFLNRYLPLNFLFDIDFNHIFYLYFLILKDKPGSTHKKLRKYRLSTI